MSGSEPSAVSRQEGAALSLPVVHTVTEQHVWGVQLPLDGEHANTRKAAIAVLQAMLAQPELATRRDGSPAVTPDFVRTAFARLTGHEMVQLLDWADVAPTTPQLSWYKSCCHSATLLYVIEWGLSHSL